jgi:sulfite oxidase
MAGARCGDAERMEALHHWSREPLNAETRAEWLAVEPITPAEAFYIRSHGNMPAGDIATHRVRVSGLVMKEMELSVENLWADFPEHTVVALLECAGNRRAELMAVRDMPGEIPWGPGALGTAAWTGVRLGYLLTAAGLGPGSAHVGLTGADQVEDGRYSVSIPLSKARRGEVLLAWAMNGEPLPREHGGPLRAIIPGYVGARSVKWLTGVEVRAEPAEGMYQARQYRMKADDADPGFPLGELAVNAAICSPVDGQAVAAGVVTVRGYALPGAERHVARVDVSGDGGRTWTMAQLAPDQGLWAWRRWTAHLELPAGSHELVARTWNSAAETQPERAETVWNPGGYANTAWPRVTVQAG